MNKTPMFVSSMLILIIFLHWTSRGTRLTYFEMMTVVALQVATLILNELISLRKVLQDKRFY